MDNEFGDKQDILLKVGGNASDLEICYLASKGKYGFPNQVSYNCVSCFFVMHDETGRIIGNVKRSYYLFAKEVLESTYLNISGKVFRLSPLDESYFQSSFDRTKDLLNKDANLLSYLPLGVLIGFGQEQASVFPLFLKQKPKRKELLFLVNS